MTSEELDFAMMLSRGMVDEDFCEDYQLFLDLVEKHNLDGLTPRFRKLYLDENDKAKVCNIEIRLPIALEELLKVLNKKYNNEILATAYMIRIWQEFKSRN